jgi:hypothetical protein
MNPAGDFKLWRWADCCAVALVRRRATENGSAAAAADPKQIVGAATAACSHCQTRHQQRTGAMLRITTDEKPRVLTFRLEGRLEGPWAGELEKCWRGLLDGNSPPTVRVDLTGVTFVDAAGRARLAAMHRSGAEFVAADCLMKAIVDEIGAGESRAEEEPS